MANLWQPSLARATDDNGDSISGAKLKFYATGTTTDASWFTDSAGLVEGTNPLVADANGIFAAAYLDPDTTYRIQLTDASDSVIFDVDPVKGFDESSASGFADTASSAAASAAEDAALAEAARIAAEAAEIEFDEANLDYYATPKLGVDTVAAQERFGYTSITGDFDIIMRSDGTDAVQLKKTPKNAAGIAALGKETTARSRAETYGLDHYHVHSIAINGRAVTNYGLAAPTGALPGMQLAPAAGVHLDADGNVSTGERTLFPDGIVNSLGLEEIVSISHNSTGDEHRIFSGFDIDGVAALGIEAFGSIRQATGSTRDAQVRITHTSGGETAIDLSSDYTQFSLEISSYNPASDNSSVEMSIDPDGADVGDPAANPVVWEVELFDAVPLGVKVPTLAEVRTNRREGHAFAFYAAPGMATFSGGGFVPSSQCPSLLYEIGNVTLETISLSALFSMADVVPATNPAFVLGAFSTEQPTGEDPMNTVGLVVDGGDEDTQYWGKMAPYPKQSNQEKTDAPAVRIPGRGNTHLFMQFGGASANASAVYSSSLLASRPRSLEIYIDGICVGDDAHGDWPADFKLRGMSIGGADIVTEKPYQGYKLDGAEIYSTSDRINRDYLTEAQVLDFANAEAADLDKTIARNGAIILEGDSKLSHIFTGSPGQYQDRFGRQDGVVIANWAAPSRLWETDATLIAAWALGNRLDESLNSFNHPYRKARIIKSITEMQRAGYPPVILYVAPGTNGPSHLVDVDAAYEDYRSFYIDDIAAEFPAGYVIPVIQSVAPAGSSDPNSANNVIWTNWHTKLLTRFGSVHADSPLLRPTNQTAGTDFAYLFDLYADTTPALESPSGVISQYTNMFEIVGQDLLPDSTHWAALWGGYNTARKMRTAFTAIGADNGFVI